MVNANYGVYNNSPYTLIESIDTKSYSNNIDYYTPLDDDYNLFAFNQEDDWFETAQINNPVSTSSLLNSSEMKLELQKTKSEQGPIGKLWDGIKNLTGIGASSNKAEQAIKDYENGKITQKEMEESVNSYKEGQEECVDTVANIVSGIASMSVFIAATAAGLAAAPFTGGASLGLIAAGIGLSTASGAATKAAVKKLDCAIGGREYDSLKSDLISGSINGLFAPFTAGIGGSAAKLLAQKLGVTVAREGGEIALNSGIQNTLKGKLVNMVVNNNKLSFTGSTKPKRAIVQVTNQAVDNMLGNGIKSGIDYASSTTSSTVTSDNIKYSLKAKYGTSMENANNVKKLKTKYGTSIENANNVKKSLTGLITNIGKGMLLGLVTAPIAGYGVKLTGLNMGRISNNSQDNNQKTENKNIETIMQKLF